MKPAAACLAAALFALSLGCASGAQTGKGADTTDGGRTPTLQALAFMRQGSLYFQQGRTTEAQAEFEKADRLAPGNATTYNMIGLCHLALTSFNRALELIPAFTDARNNRGSTYLAMGQFRLAEVDFTGVLGDSTYPHHWEAYYNLGLANLAARNLAAAEDNFRRAISAPLPVFEAYLRLAEVRQQQGNPKSAEQLLDEAMLRFPDRAEAPLALGRLLVTLGRVAEARPYLERIMQSYPDSAMAAEARRILGG